MSDNTEKLSKLGEIAEVKSLSDNISDLLLATVIFNGIIDFLAIQSARLVEQIILKGKIAEGSEAEIAIHNDEWFYSKKVYTRKILKEIKKLLPFYDETLSSTENEKLNSSVEDFIKASHEFLDARNIVIHNIGNPRISTKQLQEDAKRCCDLAKIVSEKHKEMCLKLQPYTLTDEQRKKYIK